MTDRPNTIGVQIDHGWLRGQRIVFGPGSYVTGTRFDDCVFAFVAGEGVANFDQCEFVDCHVETEEGLEQWGPYILRAHGRGFLLKGNTRCTDTTTGVAPDGPRLGIIMAPPTPPAENPDDER